MLVSALTAAVCGLLLTALSINVSRLRIRYKVSYGHAGHTDLEVAVRAHGNTLEQAMLFLILLVVAELVKAPSTALAITAHVFVAARALHAYGMLGRKLPLRQAAHITSVLCQLVLIGLLLRVAL
jgi:uncharacterized membrane protein YecN with MAPEG domain